MKKRKLKLEPSSYERIRESALNNYKSSPVVRNAQGNFLAVCWVGAVIDELQRLGEVTEIEFVDLIASGVKYE